MRRFREKICHQRSHERLLAVVLIVGMLALAITSCGCTEAKGHLVTEQYTVQQGDTLDGISYRFMEKSSVRRDVREFREGIIEANWELLKDRYPYAAIREGDCLQINYWVTD